MKSKYFALIAVLVVTAAIFFVAIPKIKESKPHEKPVVNSFVSGFTAGLISNQSHIQVIFSENVPENKMKEDAGKLLKFSPDIKATASWINPRTLKYIPEESLKAGQVYHAKVFLDKIFNTSKEQELFEFSFQVRKQGYESRIEGIKPYDMHDLSRQKLMGEVRFADFINMEKLENFLDARQDKKSLPVHWEISNDKNTYRFIVDSVIRSENTGELNLHWDASLIGAEGNSEEKIEIPALGVFKVMEVKHREYPEQQIAISFSDPLKSRQNMRGLVYFEQGMGLRTEINGNNLLVYPDQRIKGKAKIIVHPAILNNMGYPLNTKFSATVNFESIKPAVKFIGKGNIIPGKGEKLIAFQAVNLRSVDVTVIKVIEKNIQQFFQVNTYTGNQEMKRVGRIVYKKEIPLLSDEPIDYGEWNTFRLDLSNLFETETGALYRVKINFRKEQSLFPCENSSDEESLSSNDLMDQEDPGDYDYWSWNGYDSYEWTDEYYWRDRDNPCKASYYMHNNRMIAKNLLATNLGIIAKGNQNNDLLIIVNDLLTTKPVSGAKIEIYNFQKQLIESAETNSKGIAEIKFGRKAFFVIAKKGEELSYLRIDNGSALSMSMFNIAGVEAGEGIKGFIYGERGVWRPGDSIYMSFFLEDKLQQLPENHPVLFELRDPNGKLYCKQMKSNSMNGLYDFRTATKTNAVTGNWSARVKVGANTFSKRVRIESIKPNRLKISLNFGEDMIRTGDVPQGKLNVKWLHGAKAGDLKTDVFMSLMPRKTVFEGFPGYQFDDLSKVYDMQEFKLYDAKLDENGDALVVPEIGSKISAPGMLTASFRIRAFQKSGEFSQRHFSLPYSPFASYAGIKIPKGEGWNGALMSDRKHQIPLVNVQEDGKTVGNNNLLVEVFKLQWRWWWERTDNYSISRFVNNLSKNLIQESTIDIRDGKGLFSLKLDEKYWGRVLIRVTDQKSGHSSSQIVYMDYPGWWENQQGRGPGGESMLSLNMDKDSYVVGEKAELMFPSGKGGRALISIESGSDIIETDWVETNEELTKYSFKVKEEMSPNVYVHVSYLQPHEQSQNDLPLRMYGVQPVMVEYPDSHLNPVIDMPDVLEPEKKVKIKVEEASGKEMSYTLAMVDEGLLDITSFKTPNPWDSFNKREALGIMTWDMYDYVLGALSGTYAGLYEIGGDEYGQAVKDQKAIRFKPVVKFLGPFYLKGGKTAKHEIMMPNYVGSVRVMIIAGSHGAYGKAEKTCPVKKDLMVYATLPRVLGPGEKIDLPVSVFAMDQKVKNVELKIQTNDLFTEIIPKRQIIHFEEEGDQLVRFSMRSALKPGKAKIEVLASSGREKASYEIEVDVRPSNPEQIRTQFEIIEPGEDIQLDYEAFGLPGTNKSKLELSGILPMGMESRLKYLIDYPHGCVEQVVSAAFPQLYLENLTELTRSQKQEIQRNIEEALFKLRDYQQSDGGLSYWPGNHSNISEWGTSYAGHFVLEAKRKGFNIPSGWLEQWLAYQSKKARAWSWDKKSSTRTYLQKIQAYRLYTLSLAGEPSLGAMNRLKEDKSLDLQSTWMLAGAYHIDGKEDAARDLVFNRGWDYPEYQELSYTYGSTLRDYAMTLLVLSDMGEKEDAFKLVQSISNRLASNEWMSTQTSAFALMSLANFYGGQSNSTKLEYEYRINGDGREKVSTDDAISSFDLSYQDKKGKVWLKNKGESDLYVCLSQWGVPFVGEERSEENDLLMSIAYYDLANKPLDVTSLEQGTDFYMEVQVKNPNLVMDYEEMVLAAIFPSGWEIRNMRLEEYQEAGRGMNYDYQDIRDDRVYTYFDLRKGAKKAFRVYLNASYSGSCYLPAITCKAMYNEAINATKAGKWVAVRTEGKEEK